MTPPPLDLKNTTVAGILAFLVPGAGHLYQGRIFKAVLYFVCIVGMYAGGQYLGAGRAVTFDYGTSAGFRFGFVAQAAVGLPTLFAFVQNSRYRSESNRIAVRSLASPLSADFEGELFRFAPPEGLSTTEVAGRIELAPAKDGGGALVEGTFVGRTGTGDPVELKLRGAIELGHAVDATPRRRLQVLVGEDGGMGDRLDGTIPRRFLDWFEVPLEDVQLQGLHATLGKWYELACVYTWIAGLLNFLAIWDAVLGPAYGAGSEEDEGAAVDAATGDRGRVLEAAPGANGAGSDVAPSALRPESEPAAKWAAPPPGTGGNPR